MATIRVMRVAILAIAVAGCGRSEPPPAPCTPAPGSSIGDGTYYDADGTGKCSFQASPDRMVAAINGADYTAARCGTCLEVIGENRRVVVTVVDICPGCKRGDLDLSREAFHALAPLDKGRIKIVWREVPCEPRGPLEFHIKAKSNAQWTGIQVRDHRYPIAKLESYSAGEFHDIARADYNYFVGKALGPGPYTLRVTDARGRSRIEPMVPLAVGQTVQGVSQFSRCAGD
jgi:expansin (peptidoglycan-binding protein)